MGETTGLLQRVEVDEASDAGKTAAFGVAVFRERNGIGGALLASPRSPTQLEPAPGVQLPPEVSPTAVAFLHFPGSLAQASEPPRNGQSDPTQEEQS